MPKYANGSLEKALYSDIKHEFRENPGKEERKNSVRSRAHRQVLAPTATAVEDIDKIRGIKRICEMHSMGWVSSDNFLNIVREIVKGE
jgi:hypothetical protein